MLEDILPILILLGIAFVAIAIAIVLKIRSKKSLILDYDKDFIDEILEKKKRQLNTNLSGLTWKTYVALLIAMPIIIAAICLAFLENKAFSIVFAFLGCFIPELIVTIKSKREKSKFEEKYAMALRSLASGLRSGLSLEQAIVNVGRNTFLDANIRNGFKQISSDIKFGVPVNEAFEKFAEELGSEDARDIAAVISMQMEVGGSEAAVVTTILQNINDRIMARNEIKALFTDTDILILVLDFVPFALFAILYFFAYPLIEPFFQSTMMTVVLIGLLLLSVIGSVVCRKISKSAKGE